MKFTRMAMLFAALTTSVATASAQDHPDQVTDGEQRVEVGDPGPELVKKVRKSLSGVAGVAEVSGDKKAIFRLGPNARVSHNQIKAALESNSEVSVKPPTLGFNLTVDVIFKESVTPEQIPKIIEKMPTFDTLVEIRHLEGRTLRLRTAAWSPQNQRGFSVLSLVNPAASATGYRGPGAPTYDAFIQDVVFLSQPGNTPPPQ